LYLSGSVGSNGFKPTRGALAEVLPVPVRALFARAALQADRVLSWQGGEGIVHELVVGGMTDAPASNI
jgi:hypothetical protein